MEVRAAKREDRAEWLRMRRALWPESAPAELDAETAAYFNSGIVWNLPTQVIVLDRGDGRLAGFVEVSLRPFADGCVTSPVGFVEGWYIDEDLRRRGHGSRLVRAAEEWARSLGCREMGSDTWAANGASLAAHLKLGYAATDECLLLRKTLAEPVEPAEDLVGLAPNGLWVGTAVKFVTDPRAGGIDVFLGTTRAETDADGRELFALDYEAYEEMALKQLRDLAKRARERWPIIKLALLHRVGRVGLGEPSVIIAVSTPHRADAFEACRWLIDSLKVDVAIWKKEVWSDGTGTWVHPGSRVS